MMKSSPVSNMLGAILRQLDVAQLDYCVERNYHGYPETITGDVDLIVANGDVRRCVELVLETANHHQWVCYQTHMWRGTAFIGLWGDSFPARFTLTVEVFAGARWHGIEFLSGEDVVRKRSRHGITWKPNAAHQVIITVIHHLLYNNELPKKYQAEVAALSRQNIGEINSALTKYIGASCARIITDALCYERWEFFNKKSSLLVKRHLFLRSICLAPVKTFTSVVSGLKAHYSAPKGVHIIINIEPHTERALYADALIELMNKWHVFKPPYRVYFTDRENVRSLRREIGAVLRSGGVAISSSLGAEELKKDDEFPPYTIERDDQIVVRYFGEVLMTSDVDEASMGCTISLILSIILAHRASLKSGKLV